MSPEPQHKTSSSPSMAPTMTPSSPLARSKHRYRHTHRIHRRLGAHNLWQPHRLDLNNTPSISLDRVVASGVTTRTELNNTQLRDMLILPGDPLLSCSNHQSVHLVLQLRCSKLQLPHQQRTPHSHLHHPTLRSHRKAALMPLTTSLSISMAPMTIPPSPPVMS